ncbi:sensor histidine kinase [Paenibacillus lemnae]|uniref:histidine kinase n=1 Tax=Paenibacillus lemnae TaxID=1330551 RepID=A0A848M0T8_PAELE|nr:HAMP domain-containing sensor histidine kinase [Paenibacillus lemnae]NMO94457.1 HAMP domain-containing histidine kinase [Paenibacillus lemnae]
MKLRRRLAFHFTYQLIAFSLFIFIFLIGLLFVLIKHLANEEMQQNLHAGVLESITTETVTDQGEVQLGEHWKQLLAEQEMWLQVVDMSGQVIFSSNTPEDVPDSYSVSSLMEIKEEGRLGQYTMDSQMDLIYEDPLLYLLGRVDESSDRLRSWFSTYEQAGLPNPEQLKSFEDDINQAGGYLHVINEEGSILKTVGKSPDGKKAYHPLELMTMQEQPGTYSTHVNVYRDKDSGNTWVYHTPQSQVIEKQPIMNQLLQVVLWVGAAVLALAVGMSIWHGYRYSRPLLLFTGWFERMRSGSYEEVLTPKDRKKLFRKNGKLRTRYRLYKEVIHSFYDMAEQLAATEQERKRLERSREDWMSGISHDLRTPLSSIQGYGYMLESAPEDWSAAELREMGHVIREKGDYMLELINDFSLVFQLKNAARPQEMQLVDLNELVRRCVLKYVNDATLGEISFQYEGGEHPVMTAASAKWLNRLMDNLISNAVKHNPPGITVTVAVKSSADSVSILVKDDGVGMDEETQRNLFERYYRGTNTEESMDGSGLGMSIAKAIVDAHRGQVEIQSSPGRGTSIEVRLPRTETSESEGKKKL